MTDVAASLKKEDRDTFKGAIGDASDAVCALTESAAQVGYTVLETFYVSFYGFHTAPFLYKNADLNLHVFTTWHKIAQNGGLQDALQSGYLQNRRFSSNAKGQCDGTKLVVYLDHSIVKGLNPQKRYFLLRCCEQCERTRTDIYIWMFVQKQSSVND